MRSRSARYVASSRLLSERASTMNSSPPRRATVSPRAHRGPQPLADLHEQPVAGLVAHGVVHVLEAVEVEEEQRGDAATVGRVGQRRVEPFDEQGSVREAGERIVEGLPARAPPPPPPAR